MGKYKKGDKFVIEIEETMGNESYGYFYKVKGTNCDYCEDFLDRLEMIKPDEIEKEAYEKGLKDAWDASKEIALPRSEGGMNTNDLFEIFGYGSPSVILKDFTAKEAVEKIKKFEKEKEKGKIHTGDVVMSLIKDESIIVTSSNDTYLNGIKIVTCERGLAFSVCIGKDIKNYKKTGQHFDLEKIFNLDEE